MIYATTRAINAVITGTAARTALLTTKGHPEILVFREGGRTEPFNHRRVYPPPYVPRRLTWEVPERIDCPRADITPLDEAGRVKIIGQLVAEDIEAVAVCLLWAIANPVHERRVGELLSEAPPGHAVHALARTKPDDSRIPAGVVHRDRCVAKASHDATSQ